MPKKIWDPGATPYSDYLKRLTPEEKAAHLEKRRQKKSMKKAMAAVTEQYQAKWIAELHNAAWAQLVKARESGDTAAFIAVWDRIVGRPQEGAGQDNERPLPWSDSDI